MSTQRRCMDCDIPLSMYNEGIRCSLHQRKYLVAESIAVEQREEETKVQRESARTASRYCIDCRKPLSKYGNRIRCRDCARIYRGTATAKKEWKEVRSKRLMQSRGFTPETIVRGVASTYGISAEQIYGSSRKAATAWARHVVMYLIRRDLGLSFPEIARDLKKQDHTTVIHACRKIALVLEADPKTQIIIDQIRRRYMHDL